MLICVSRYTTGFPNRFIAGYAGFKAGVFRWAKKEIAGG